MITAIDTNVLLDLLIPGTPFGEVSQRALESSLQAGRLVIGDMVYAELAVHFASQRELDRFLTDTGIEVVPPSPAALVRAGHTWAQYRRQRDDTLCCPQCGHIQQVNCGSCDASLRGRQHLLSDFLIGAHAISHADRLMTRDRGYYRTYFPELSVLDPAKGGI
ncbi:MAG TPA: type II toxin-antitoxin system VapC family toxin [Patescibacteria group bacterium]|nr:type II toxin-antitoxin system VapC family toxin [Patescibacteria group bacterium]